MIETQADLHHRRVPFLDRNLVDLLKPDWEKVAYALILLLAVASRFWDLGARAMSWDECTHGLFSYYLYNGDGFTHDPMMHGPFLFHANALVFFLLGDNDYTVRFVPALFGVFMVMSPLLLRRWLGRLGAVIASVLLLISPSVLYYSRYIRNEIYIAVWMVLLAAALFHWLETRRPGWFYLGAAVLMLSLATKENAYFFGFAGLVFMIEVVLWERARRRERAWLYLGGMVLCALLLFASWWLGRLPAGGEDAAMAGILDFLHSLVAVVGGTLPAVLISATLIRPRHPQPSRVVAALRSLSWRTWLLAILVMFLIYVLLFSTFFTSPTGLATGILGSLGYWLAQQEVERGGQPWYYYGLLLAMYEFVPLFFGLLGMGYYLLRPPARNPESDSPSPGADPGLHQEPTEPSFLQPQPSPALQSLFVSFLIFWTLFSLFIYAWAGEKMPWMMVHQAVPLILLAARFAGDLFGRVDWRAVWRRGGALLAFLLPVAVLALLALLQPQDVAGWLAVLLLLLLFLFLIGLVVRRLGVKRALLVALATMGLVGLLFTVRFAWMASYINADYATELLVYAHGGADVKPTMDEIAAISQRIAGDKQIKVVYDQEAAWPLEWYLREYPNRKFFTTTPTREALDAPVVIASAEIDDRVQPFLGQRYHRSLRREIWWPSQDYVGLTWERVRDILTSPQKRRALWDILYYRRYPRAPDDWYHVDNVYLYVRKDVAQQVWGYGPVLPEVGGLPPDLYAEAHVDLSPIQVWGEMGTGPGQFNHPRGVAVGPDGHVYVVDSDNNRVQVFDAAGAFLWEWGGRCDLAAGQGCTDPDGQGPLESGDGQFQEPWGIAVASDGRVYVADTWNHRLQVFDAGGTFLNKWGTYGQTADGDHLFYGPRDVAVDATGQVYVADTGNKRVVVYDGQGRVLHQWGGPGVDPGRFEEPVGLALGRDPAGNSILYVADTWNQRVQAFDNQGTFLRQWPVEGWYGESVTNKPYLTMDGQGRVYATDPEGYRVILFSVQGEVLATLGRYGFEPDSFSLPTGLAVDSEGNLYVTDTDGHRVVKYGPLP